ncbi:glycosyltransferase family 4 protein [Halostagnicola kamekurae]|uniref:Glycosyltransferase involved in cell wall bisynthesis n=1 Tax=Halostagnicola kamekurae TaxID=619731 RepID=A0A1I6QMV8_9EURY|nr:glycosyltransferase family 4 protein [Halostagnicola kamekurae]SFS53786.1 Glycosyltransferase involved in cell wall bisynthesis [Halostagnicola kamekurae]
MKIGFIATEIGLQKGGAYMGGNVNNVITVSQALAERGHDIIIITTTPRDTAPNPTANIDWATVYEYSPRFDHGTPGYFASFSAYATRTVAKLRQQNKLNVLTVHAGFPLWGLVGTAANILTDCPVIHVQYCPVDQISGESIYDYLNHPWFIRRYLSGADELVGISPIVSDSLRNLTNQDNIQTILPAINTDIYTPVPELGKAEVPTISYLGSLNEQKGLDLLVDAFVDIQEEFDCQLRLGLEVRSKESGSELAKRIEENPDIDVNGIVDDVPKFLAESHIFVAPFRTTMGPADYPLAALEAMSCGIPIVVTDVGGLKQLVMDSNGGVCIGEPSAKGISSTVSDLLKNPNKRSTIGLRAREYILQHCSESSVADQLEELLEEKL